MTVTGSMLGSRQHGIARGSLFVPGCEIVPAFSDGIDGEVATRSALAAAGRLRAAVVKSRRPRASNDRDGYDLVYQILVASAAD